MFPAILVRDLLPTIHPSAGPTSVTGTGAVADLGPDGATVTKAMHYSPGRESTRHSLYYKFLFINIFKINKFKMNMVYKYVMLQDFVLMINGTFV